jgi:hypothetical protein
MWGGLRDGVRFVAAHGLEVALAVLAVEAIAWLLLAH